MRRRLLLSIALLAPFGLTACSRFAGPLETRRMGPVAPKDDEGRPIYSISEQKARGRERLAIPEDDFRIGPNVYLNGVSPTGR
jgi:hypothetical protein